MSLSDGRAQVACPNCEQTMRLNRLNDHLDWCLVDNATSQFDLTSDAEDDTSTASRKRKRPSPSSSSKGGSSTNNMGVLGSMMDASRHAHAGSLSQATPSRSTAAGPPPPNKARQPIERHAFAAVPSTSHALSAGPSSGPKGRAHTQSSGPGYGMGIGYTSSAAEVGSARWLDPSTGLLDGSSGSAGVDAAPLAERMRPQLLSDFVGQQSAVTSLRALLRAPRGPPSLILWAPPGTGKTTLARIIANHLRNPVSLDDPKASIPTAVAKWRMVEISAITTSLQEIKKTLDDAGARLGRNGTRTMVLVDEFQRINRGWQDAFLAAVERGTITLIAATTENPSFRIVPALLSRMRVVLLHRLESEDVLAILRRAQHLTFGPEESKVKTEPPQPFPEGTASSDAAAATPPEAASAATTDKKEVPEQDTKAPSQAPPLDPQHAAKKGERPVPDGVLQYIASNADGDARTALNTLELAWALAGEILPTQQPKDEFNPQKQAAQTTKEVVQALRESKVRCALAYDRSGDWHYDAISALHKSIRGGDASAAVYWLARMVAAGDDPLYVARRLIIAASEDCGSNPMALQMAVATYQCVQVVGLPEAGETLSQTVVYLAESPKDTRAYRAWQRAMRMVHNTPSYPVPMHIRNAPTKLMKDIGAAKEYRYEPRFLHPVVQSFLPPPLQDRERICSPPPVDDEMPFAGLPTDEAERLEVERTIGLPPLTRPQDRPPSAMEGATVHRWPMTPEVYNPSLPPSVLPASVGTGPGSCQRVLDVGSRVVDWSLLAEWENERNGGMPWQGRPGLTRAIRRMGQPEQTRD